jgi:hypothetical protein
MGGLFGGGDSGNVDIPTKKAENISRTAQPAEQISETGRKRRRRRAFGMTRDLGTPQLGLPGLDPVNAVGGL